MIVKSKRKERQWKLLKKQQSCNGCEYNKIEEVLFTVLINIE